MRTILAMVFGIALSLTLISCGGKTAATATNAAPAAVTTNVAPAAATNVAAPVDTNVVKPAPAPVNKDAGQTKGLE
ncbi:MAG: hypothetical protein HPY53_02325 [Brevinematales bacterium]|nr:hypothetical protein [Brevinematales bacterium]